MKLREFFKSKSKKKTSSFDPKSLFGLNKKTSSKSYTAVNKQKIQIADAKPISAVNEISKSAEQLYSASQLISSEQSEHITYLSKILEVIENQEDTEVKEKDSNNLFPSSRKPKPASAGSTSPPKNEPKPASAGSTSPPKNEPKPASAGSTSPPKNEPTLKPGYERTKTGIIRDTKTKRFVSPKIAEEVAKPSIMSTMRNAFSMRNASSLAKSVGKGVAGILGGLALDYGAEQANEAGYTKLSKGLNIASSTLTGASIGGTVGSIVPVLGTGIGAAVGGAIGAGIGTYQALTGSETTGQQPTFSGDDQQVMDMIKSHEGKRNVPYKDSRGLWTVGYGHLIGDGTTLPPEMNRAFSDEEIDNMFAQDYSKHKEAATKIPGFDKANSTGQAAIIDLTYNMGPNWYKKFPNVAAALQRGDFDAFSSEMQNSAWFQQVGNRGPQIVAMLKGGGGGAGEGGAGTTNTQMASAEKIPDVNSSSEMQSSGAGAAEGQAKLETQPGITLEGVDPSVIAGIEMLQQQSGKKLVISSGSRTGATPGVGGGLDPHQKHQAVDISYKSSGIGETDVKQLTQLALDAGFTGIGVEGTHLHLDKAHATKTLWGSDYHFGSAPKWAKGLTDWGNPSTATQVAQGSTSGAKLSAQSTRIEASEMSAMASKNATDAQGSNQFAAAGDNNIQSKPTMNEIPVNIRLGQLFPQITSLAA